MKKVFDNASNGWKTTLLGTLLFLSALVYLFMPILLSAHYPEFHYEADTWVLVGLLIFGVGLILVPDTILNGLQKYINKRMGMVLLLLLPHLSSCVTYSKCKSKYGSLEMDTVYVSKIDTVMQTIEKVIPGDSLFTSIQLDSLLSAPTLDTIELVSENGRGKVQFWKDKYNNFLNAKFTIPPDTVRDTVELIVEVEVPCPPVVRFVDKDKWYEKYLTWIVLAIIGGTAAILIRKF